MQYFISFLEGIITFISPCLLPMLPIYLSYFAGGETKNTRKTLLGAIGFVLGFTFIFTAMGALAGTLGSFLTTHQTAVNIISGIAVIFFGLNFLGVFKLNLFKGSKINLKTDNMNFFSLFLFGIIFSLGWTPCVGAFLGSALMMASTQGKLGTGVLMLLAYSLGLGIPFILSAVLIQKLKSTFDFIKQNYRIINLISGSFLILVGILMATGTLGRLLNLLSLS
ncbi:MAG: cytochrome c biogenesis protein CcdA [Lachnospiraceae bacterium]|nr:cytochrome c biogenesis protein CcdA [Lachnospiraceae bacterium]